ncbi:uncharacterized protein LOC135959751 [Calliphora vicina]|uniref:uncharacterized protein LOC135959751 n=1 Tax=Calliphora vicina TaxID=7373 RepID=UPI00325AAE7B
MFDLSNLSVELLDDRVHMEGSFTMLWEADPSDRVELHTDLMKYERGSWQPTVFTMIQKDFCRTLFDESDIWYKTWAQFIDGDDLKCINNKGHTYNHLPFDLETVLDVQGEDISGRHKLVIKVDAFNEQDDKQPYSVCLEIEGDIMKKYNSTVGLSIRTTTTTMRFPKNTGYIIVGLSLLLIGSCGAAEFSFLYDDNNEFFSKCENHHGNGMKDLADMSEFTMEVNEYNMHIEGPIEAIWDVESTDRIDLRMEVFKYQRGTWQPTVYSVIKPDLCATMYSKDEVWYDVFTSTIREDTRKCINEKGSILIVEPSDELFIFSVNGVDLSGRHKIIFHIDAFDENNEKRPNDLCIEINGEFVKM